MERDIDKKFEYLNETKNLIKNSIINKGVYVSNEDTFRSYADKINSIPSGSGDFVIDNVLLDGDTIPEDFNGLIIVNSDRADYVINTPKSEDIPNITSKSKEDGSILKSLYNYISGSTRTIGFNSNFPLIHSYSSDYIFIDKKNIYHTVYDFNENYSFLLGARYVSNDESYEIIVSRNDSGIDIIKYYPSTDTISVENEHVFDDAYFDNNYYFIFNDEIIALFDLYQGLIITYNRSDYSSLFDNSTPFDYIYSRFMTNYDMSYSLENKTINIKYVDTETDNEISLVDDEINFNDMTIYRNVSKSMKIINGGYLNMGNIEFYVDDNNLYTNISIINGHDESTGENFTKDIVYKYDINQDTLTSNIIYDKFSTGSCSSYSNYDSFSIKYLREGNIRYISHTSLSGTIYVYLEDKQISNFVKIFEKTTEDVGTYYTFSFEANGIETVVINPEIQGKYNIMCCGNLPDVYNDNYVVTNYYNMYNPTLISKSANLKLPVLGITYNGQRIPYIANGQYFS